MREKAPQGGGTALIPAAAERLHNPDPGGAGELREGLAQGASGRFAWNPLQGGARGFATIRLIQRRGQGRDLGGTADFSEQIADEIASGLREWKRQQAGETAGQWRQGRRIVSELADRLLDRQQAGAIGAGTVVGEPGARGLEFSGEARGNFRRIWAANRGGSGVVHEMAVTLPC